MDGRSKYVMLLLCVWLICLVYPISVNAFSNNPNHKLGVYSLYDYGKYGGEAWKNNVTPSDNADPAKLFWNIMTSRTTPEYAHSDSRCRVNAQITYETIFPVPGSAEKNWNQFDMVFFYGHNNMITPPHICATDPPAWRPFWSNQSGTWTPIGGNWCDWGTPALPYEYYYKNITSGKSQPGAVVYLYEPFTSALLGYDFQPGTSWVVQKVAKDTPAGNSPGTTVTCSGGLGRLGLKWLILHGCQAVIVANEDGSAYNHMGVQAFKQTWEGFHLILGHYIEYSTSDLKDLQLFANYLRAGWPVQEAYFKTDPHANSSAISAESWLSTDYFTGRETWTDFMDTETWTYPKANITGSPGCWQARWIQRVGTLATEWEEEAEAKECD